MPSITAHTIVNNEEHFIAYAIRSVLPHVDTVLVYDTGSEDRTVEIVRELQLEFPGKINLEEKGNADKVRHTELRQEMLKKTTTDWFMILDGDEVWTDRGMQEALALMKTGKHKNLIAPFYLCVGDVYHASPRGMYEIRGELMHATPRFFRLEPGLHWSGEYNMDAVCDADGQRVFEGKDVHIMTHKFWHLTHLPRSNAGADTYSSGGVRGGKIRLTHFLIGKPIDEPVPESFTTHPSAHTARLAFVPSLLNFIRLAFGRLTRV